MYSSLKKGVVKFFDKQKGWGFITPDPDKSGKIGHELYFRGENGCPLQEEFLGEINMNFDPDELLPMPEGGDEVVYLETPSSHVSNKGPSAFAWSYMGYYRQASQIINARPNPTDPMCRAVHYPRGMQPQVLCIKPWSEFVSQLARRDTLVPWFLQLRDDVQFEELRFGGWLFHPHPAYLASELQKSANSAA